ncbi:ATP-binding cassette sub-family C member 4-like [Liolophura sinensis]|uniref:ATP-binding cassette sub-family C member 4-like n=1 Tax=Liolophura sinensis TaxID=3198878 RepID=UPI0031587268
MESPPGTKPWSHLPDPSLRKPQHWWQGQVFWKGYRNNLDEADIYEVLPQDSTVQLSNNLAREWEKELYCWKTGGRPSLLAAVFRCYWQQIITFALLILLEECARVGQAVLMGELIGVFEVSPSGNSLMDAYIYAAGLGLCYLANIFLDHQYFHYGYKMKVALTSLIYRKLIRLPYFSLTPSLTENLLNTVGREVDIYPAVVLPAMYVVIGPIQLVVVCYLLWDWLKIGPVSLSGIGVMLLLVPLQLCMGRFSKSLRHKSECQTGERLQLFHMVLRSIREVKMACMESFSERLLLSKRRREFKTLKKLSCLLGLNTAVTLTAGKVVTFLTFCLYLILHGIPSAKQVFTTMALYETLRVSVSILLPSGVMYGKQAHRTLRKIQKMLLLEERGFHTLGIGLSSCSEQLAVRIEDYTGLIDKGTESCVVVSDVQLSLEKGKMHTIIGPPESGKTSLLLAMIGEVQHHKGSIQRNGKVVYISPTSWMFPGSVRENITFGAEFVRYRYTQILQACALYQAVEMLPQGELTTIGEQGVPLDASFQARIALARAIYQNCDIFLVDGILKAMDPRTAMHVFDKCLCGLLRGKTVVLVTDSFDHVRTASRVVLMSRGSVLHKGSYQELTDAGLDLQTYLQSHTQLHARGALLCKEVRGPSIQELPLVDTFPLSTEDLRERLLTSGDIFKHNFKESCDINLGESEAANGGLPTRDIYWQYFILGGSCLGVLLFVLLSALLQGTFIVSEWWLAYWPDVNRSISKDIFLNHTLVPSHAEWMMLRNIYIYMALTVGTVILGILQATSFFQIASQAASKLHDEGLEGVLQSPLSFFHSNTLGTLLSCFSRDVSIVDQMAATYLDSIQSLSLLMATLLLVGILNYWLFLLVLPVVIIFALARAHFLQTTQDLRKLELTAKNCVSSHIASTIGGLRTIRSYSVEERFLHSFDVLQDRSTAACYLHIGAKNWFGKRIDILGLLVVIGVSLAAILVVQFQGSTISAPLFGLSLIYALHLINVLQPALVKSASVQFKMASVDRLLQCYQLPSESDYLPGLEYQPAQNWPMYGILTLEGVSLLPTQKGPTCLKSIWCCVRAEEKMGIMFMNAAEQQSFLSVLCRLSDYSGMVRLDGVDSATVSLQRLRQCMAVIPKNPPLMLGTIRQNIDPETKYTDAQIWRVFEQVQLSSLIEKLPHKFYTEARFVSPVFSVGQIQLLWLARALLKQPKLVIIEEASSNPNLRCNTVLHCVSRAKLLRSTIIYITHLPDTAIDLDRVMVVSGGRVQECDPPHVLFQDKTSFFYKMCEELGEAELNRLQCVAQEKYENKPYVSPPINPSDLEDPTQVSPSSASPINLNVLPSFHSSRLVGVLNQLPTNKFSTERL